MIKNGKIVAVKQDAARGDVQAAQQNKRQADSRDPVPKPREQLRDSRSPVVVEDQTQTAMPENNNSERQTALRSNSNTMNSKRETDRNPEPVTNDVNPQTPSDSQGDSQDNRTGALSSRD